MKNQYQQKWHQKPNSIIVLLIIFFPLGLYFMWKNEIWSIKTRWIITSIFIFAVILNSGNKNSSNTDENVQSTNDTSVSVQKVTFSEAESFMLERCNNINQTLMKKKTVTINGTKLYMFMSVAENGQACISSISEHKLEVLAADCGEVYTKIEQWNNLN
jgi:hypothetical protein